MQAQRGRRGIALLIPNLGATDVIGRRHVAVSLPALVPIEEETG